METQEILESNKLIAEFMGLVLDGTFYRGNDYLPFNFETYAKSKSVHEEQMSYHLSWDWLIPVVQKCMELQPEGINDFYNDFIDSVLYLDKVYQAVIKFIKWYNKEKENG